MRPKYRKPPLYEAICEFYFQPQPLAPELPRRFEEGFQELFSSDNLRSEPHIQQEVIYDEKGRASVENVQLHRFWRSESSFVTLGNDTLAVHQKRPYSGWEEFSPFVLEVMNLLTTLRPTQLEQVIVRYDNRLEWEQPSVHLAKWLEIQPVLGESLGPRIGAFSLSIQIPQDDDYVQIELSSDEREDTSSARIWLNLSHITVGDQINADLRAMLQRAHDRVEVTFEACLKPALRELFEIEESGETHES